MHTRHANPGCRHPGNARGRREPGRDSRRLPGLGAGRHSCLSNIGRRSRRHSATGRVRIWLDAQLSPALAPWVGAVFGVTCVAVRDLGLRDADDRTIFEAARAASDVVILSKDSDFVDPLCCALVRRPRPCGPPAATSRIVASRVCFKTSSRMPWPCWRLAMTSSRSAIGRSSDCRYPGQPEAAMYRCGCGIACCRSRPQTPQGMKVFPLRGHWVLESGAHRRAVRFNAASGGLSRKRTPFE